MLNFLLEAVVFIFCAGFAVWLIHTTSLQLELTDHSARFVGFCVVATVFYALKDLVAFFMGDIPAIVNLVLGLYFFAGLVFYFVALWKNRKAEAHSIIGESPHILLPAALLLGAVIFILWGE